MKLKATRRLPRVMTLVVLSLLLGSLMGSAAGCQALGVLTYKIFGPAAVPAKYVPDKKRPMLVLVENYQHQSSGAAASDLLGQYVARELQTYKTAPIIPPEKLQALRDERGEDFRTMSITAIGQAVGAEQVLYVQLQSSDVTPLAGGESFSGQSAATVRVVDVANGETLWPSDLTAGYGVSASVKLGATAKSVQDVRLALNQQLAGEISRLFRKWKPDDMSPESYDE